MTTQKTHESLFQHVRNCCLTQQRKKPTRVFSKSNNLFRNDTKKPRKGQIATNGNTINFRLVIPQTSKPKFDLAWALCPWFCERRMNAVRAGNSNNERKNLNLLSVLNSRKHAFQSKQAVGKLTLESGITSPTAPIKGITKICPPKRKTSESQSEASRKQARKEEPRKTKIGKIQRSMLWFYPLVFEFLPLKQLKRTWESWPHFHTLLLVSTTWNTLVSQYVAKNLRCLSDYLWLGDPEEFPLWVDDCANLKHLELESIPNAKLPSSIVTLELMVNELTDYFEVADWLNHQGFQATASLFELLVKLCLPRINRSDYRSPCA